jgi:hypothetical protein
MKKFSLLLLACFSISLGAFAQYKAESKVNPSFGLRAGYNYATWGGQSVEDFANLGDQFGAFQTEAVSGFHAGGYVNLPIGQNFSIEPGIQYSQKGIRVSQAFIGENSSIGFLNPRLDVTSRMQYLDAPILAKVTTNQGFQVYAGPQFSYLLNQDAIVEGGILGFSYEQDFELNRGFRKFDVGLTAGLGYQLLNGLNFNVGYDYGLNSLDEGNSNVKAYNRVVKVSVGYQF